MATTYGTIKGGFKAKDYDTNTVIWLCGSQR